MMFALLWACGGSKGPVDELAGAPTAGKNDLVLGWLDPGLATTWIEVRVTADGGKPKIWRQEVGADGRLVGAVGFDEAAQVELRDPVADKPLGDPIKFGPKRALGISAVGPAHLSWQVGRDLPAPNAAVDARPGPPDGWLPAAKADARPLVVGLSEADATAGWPVGPGTTPTRSLGPGEGRPAGFATFDNGAVDSITLRFSGDRCASAADDLAKQYAAPGPTWLGGRYRAGIADSHGKCAVTFEGIDYAGPRQERHAHPSAVLERQPGPPSGWLTARDGAPVTPLAIGATEADVVATWQLGEAPQPGVRELSGVAVGHGGHGLVNFKEGAVAKIDLVFDDPSCADVQHRLEAVYGPGTPGPSGQWRWSGGTAAAVATPANATCVVTWTRPV
jgi:hypothetical protein